MERVNSRLAGGFGFERPGIRRLAKMHLRVTMEMAIMLAMALGRIRAGQPKHLRSLVKPAWPATLASHQSKPSSRSRAPPMSLIPPAAGVWNTDSPTSPVANASEAAYVRATFAAPQDLSS